MFKLQEHLDKWDRNRGRGNCNSSLLPCIVCADGFTMSVQVGLNLYCTPRSNFGPWTAVEIGLPSEVEELLIEYADDPEDPTDTIYRRVPVELVEQVIEKHGGFARLEGEYYDR